MKRTKIFCTIGPASETSAMMEKMIKAGMNVARLNMSHGTYDWHKSAIKNILSASKSVGEPVTLLADIQGPKIRLGVLPEKGVMLKNGSFIEFTTDPRPPVRAPLLSEDRLPLPEGELEGVGAGVVGGALPVTYAQMHKDVHVGDRIMIDDGILEVKVTKISGKTIEAKVINGGLVTSHKGMNFPDTTLRVNPITVKDKADITFAVKAEVQWIAMSFVTRAADVKTMRGLLKKAMKKGQLEPKIIVKIEKHEALDAFDAILASCDGIMVARGDLGVETPAEDVPLRQKEMIAKCRAQGKMVVVATQMLDSMMRNPRPTRAEVSDVANAVIDHTEAVMLSGETASGKYPVQAVEMMKKICVDTEASAFDDLQPGKEKSLAAELSQLAQDKSIDAIVTAIASPLSEGGLRGVGVKWWEIIASLNRFRPQVPIYLACSTDAEARQWNVRWGFIPFVLNKKGSAIDQLREMKFLKRRETVALVTMKGKKPIVTVVEV